jgi:prepilin-type processing-associated H-X9-DG protein
LLLPAVQKVREAAARAQCQNNLKQIGLAVHNYESSYRQLPHPGQCDSTGSATTTYMTQSTAVILLPYIEQENVYRMFDQSLTFPMYGASAANGYTTGTGAVLHPKARGAVYNDPNFPNNIAASKTQIKIYVCPSTPINAATRAPDGYGCFDYMFIAVTDVEDGLIPGALTPLGWRPPAGPRRQAMTREGMLSCEGRTLVQVYDGTSNTILCIEDAGRAHPNTGQFASLSNRPSAINEGPAWSGGSSGGRRMYAWADPDAVTNGVSGPSSAISPASRVLKINNYGYPLGGPPECRWTVNNCGPNDEPFGFHPGGCNALMGDGSVRFLKDTLSWDVLKWLSGAFDGQSFTME